MELAELMHLSIASAAEWEGNVSGQVTESGGLISAIKEAVHNNTCIVMLICTETISGYYRHNARAKWSAISMCSVGLER
jgi:hypothetical protein